MNPQVGDVWAFGNYEERYLIVKKLELSMCVCLEMTKGEYNSYWIDQNNKWRRVA